MSHANQSYMTILKYEGQSLGKRNAPKQRLGLDFSESKVTIYLLELEVLVHTL